MLSKVEREKTLITLGPGISGDSKVLWPQGYKTFFMLNSAGHKI